MNKTVDSVKEALPLLAMIGTALGALLNFWIARRKGDVDQFTAVTSGAEATVTASRTAVEILSGEVKRMSEVQERMGSELEAMRERLAGVEARERSAQALVQSFVRWAHRIHDDWPALRESVSPPPWPADVLGEMGRCATNTKRKGR